ncbi:relaxase/mobilization nuclease domain-containing protein [Ahrensia sp. R2A130]|uniref:relaxase/mobilization nuclease domain-containing protein n=1 Tax=Ahrensia sp. R2A130 TaxID=744979 RepID=UPI0001E0C302|nr:relaxase/mobilization nuclease [Ahrensia sp. R2A130]EFL90211.1 relaxase/mobilization nuclease domain-containing protein [Ahrensia sp. R2A130]
MIIVGSERGSARELAAHLLNDKDGNEHITVHELRGFISDDLEGALEESYAISKGTKCRKHLFSCSFNPPAHEEVNIAAFEEAIERVEFKNGLIGQPRAIVFHEKEGRRHAHAVWSRIDAETMTAKNLSHYKLKCQSISRELYHEHEWKMPDGLARKGAGDPRNYTLAEYQQSKRMDVDPRDLKGAIQDAYAASDNRVAFTHALSERGYILARGDRRGHVSVTPQGEVLSIARYVGKKAKEIRAKLGEPDEHLPSVEAAKRDMAMDMRKAFVRHAKEAKTQHSQTQDDLKQKTDALTAQHKADRQALDDRHKQRWLVETKARSDQLNSGLKGLWQWVTGQRAQIQAQNKREALEAQQRDRKEQDRMIAQQLAKRRELAARQAQMQSTHKKTLEDLRADQKRAREHLREMQASIKTQRDRPRRERKGRAQRDANSSHCERTRDGPDLEP